MTTAIAKPETKKDIRSYIQSDVVKKQIAMVLPKHLTPDVMARVVCTAILKTPKLAQCKIESLLQSVMLLSQFGLLPDGRSAHLIPYGDVCTAIIDYKGYMARASENGLQNITYDIVCFNDKFTWKRTEDGLEFNHEIDFRVPDRGDMFAAYCTWKNAQGLFEGEIMTKLEIDTIRKRSKASSSGPWVTDYNEMAKKTVVRRSAKRWPLDAKFKELIESGTLKSAATVELDELPELSELESAPEQKAIEQPSQPAPEKETPRTAVVNALLAANVSFDDARSFIQTKNLAHDADSWSSWDEVPDVVFSILASQPKTMGELVKKFGVK